MSLQIYRIKEFRICPIKIKSRHMNKIYRKRINNKNNKMFNNKLLNKCNNMNNLKKIYS